MPIFRIGARTIRLLKRHAHPLVRLARRLRDEVEHPALVQPQPGERVLVLAPHMDDEAIGCGGAVLRHVHAGQAVTVAYLTDGAEGARALRDAAMDEAQAQRLRGQLRHTRRDEALRWCEAAGVASPQFLDLPDGGLHRAAGDPRMVDRLAELVRGCSPSLVYLPSPLDAHPDHQAAGALALRALARAGAQPQLRGYEVWTPVLANAVMDIGAVMDDKLRLLRLHVSQLADIDYTQHVEALNRYRALLLPHRRGHAEAFLQLTPDRWAGLLERQP